MNIKSITFVAAGKQFNLKRDKLVPSNELTLSDTRGSGTPEHQWDVLGNYTVTNEAAAARLIHFKCEGFRGTAGDIADYQFATGRAPGACGRAGMGAPMGRVGGGPRGA